MELVVSKGVTIVGPGANLLEISGDSDGDGGPDTKIMTVSAAVNISGVRFSHGKGANGGAISIQSGGDLKSFPL